MDARQRILNFIEEIRPLNLHGFEIRQDGERILSASAAPFDNTVPHRLYSVSKSVVSLAVGILVSEGKLRLTDRVIPFFPDMLPERVPEELERLTVHELLTMTACYNQTRYRPLLDRDWTRPFFEGVPDHAGGTIFTYDTGATQVMGSLVERLSGQPLLSFVRERLFEPLGIQNARWLRDQAGNAQAGTGLILPLSELALLCDFCMSDGRGLLDPGYLSAATSFQVRTDHRSMPEERFGYGYYFWMMRRGFSMYGMGGQMGLCLPERRLSLTTTADRILEGTGVQPIYDAFFRHLSGIAADPALAQDPEIVQALSGYSVPPVCGEAVSQKMRLVLEPGLDPVRAVRIEAGTLTFETDAGEIVVPAEPGKWTAGQFPPIGPCLSSGAMTGPGQYQARIELVGDTSCAIHVNIALRQDRATVLLQSSVWECVPGYAGMTMARVC